MAATSGGLNLAMESRLVARVVQPDVGDVNGEEVEKRTRDQQWIEAVRTVVGGIGFAMGVVGIWGDGA